MKQHRDHGGNLDEALARLGGARADWLDLSTGINPDPYPVPPIPSDAWAALPRKAEMTRLCEAAAACYGTPARVIAMNGAQGAIQAVPWLCAPGDARVLGPTYNEHSRALRHAGWEVAEVTSLAALEGAALAVVVNPNNPDGQFWPAPALATLAARVGLLVVDESFADATPEHSLAGLGLANTVILRSFGKFYGLAGLRLGFALASGDVADQLAELAGPWPVSGPAIEIASMALRDSAWAARTRTALHVGAARLDGSAARAGWRLVGGTPLFRLYDTACAKAAQERLAEHRVWSRIFPYSDTWIRLGLPREDRWEQVETAIGAARCR